MLTKILIVEDEFVVANDLRMILTKSGYEVCGIADSVDEAEELLELHHPDVVLLDIHLKGTRTGIDLAAILASKNIAFVYLSANSNKAILDAAKATQPYGFLVKPFREKDILVTLDIASYRQIHSLEAKFRREQELSQVLNRIMEGDMSWEERLRKIAAAMQPFIPFDFIILGLKKPDDDPPRACCFFRTGFDSYQTFRLPDFLSVLNISPAEFVEMREKVVADGAKIYNGKDFEELCAQVPLKRRLARKFDLNSNLSIPLNMTREGVFLFSFHSRSVDGYLPEHLQLLKRLQPALEINIDRLLAFDEIQKLNKQLKPQPIPAVIEKSDGAFSDIIGNNYQLLNIFDRVMQVAPLDTSVLLLGESGTGKERIASSIHELSGRRKKAFVKLNCAALPVNLIESELFGHEKGAFTGATDRRIGKFEQAEGGTLFLDEIGEMPLDLQVKLLRVLQEKEIERVGGSQTIRINVRIIAATNRNLENEIAQGKFRLDLYYRLNVFPLTLPSLRNRKDDIPLLVQFFADRFSRKTGKAYHGFAQSAMTELEEYNWPGNIRELENVIEQAFVLNDGKTQLQLGRQLKNPSTQVMDIPVANEDPAKTLQEIRETKMNSEKDHILSVLKSTNGRIRGAGGAAEKLQLKPTTLESRMEKLGIKKTFGVNDPD